MEVIVSTIILKNIPKKEKTMIIRDLEHLELVAGESKILGMGVDIKAGPIFSNDDAQLICPGVAAAVGGTWNGNWVTTVPNKMSVCNIDGNKLNIQYN